MLEIYCPRPFRTAVGLGLQNQQPMQKKLERPLFRKGLREAGGLLAKGTLNERVGPCLNTHSYSSLELSLPHEPRTAQSLVPGLRWGPLGLSSGWCV